MTFKKIAFCHPAASPPKRFFDGHIFRIWQLSSLKEREMA